MSRATKIALWSVGGFAAMLAFCVALLLSIDWNRAKPWINQRVSEASGRVFAINGDLSLTWHAPQGEPSWRAWIPWPRLKAQEVSFGNPDWAQDETMAQAQEVTFSVKLLPLLSKKIVIPSLALNAPTLRLERLQDGRNNWRFQSDEPSAWQVELQRLILNNGNLEIKDAIKQANLKADIETLGADSKEGYRIGWRMSGTFNGETVSGTGRAGGVLSLQEANGDYPLEARMRVGKTVVEAVGTLTRPRQLAALDMQLKLSGVSLAQLYPLTGMVLPETRPYATAGRLSGSPGNWRYEKFTGKMGASDVAGSLHYRAGQPRPRLEGTVVSNYLNFNDLSPVVGADSPASRAARGSKTVQPTDKVLPVEPFKTARWDSIDADVQFTGRKIVRKEELPIDKLVTRIQLQDGVLSLAPLKFGIAGGSLVANLTLNGKARPLMAQMKVSARHLKLKQLFPKAVSMQASLGEINGDAALTGSGNAIADLLASANGEIKTVINQGTISKLFLEQIGLNIGSIVLTQLFGDRQIQLRCAASDFAVDKGVMRTRTFVVDTQDATIYVNGNIDLADEQLDLKIYPESKGLRLISLRSPLYVAGPFKKPDVGVDKSVLAAKAGSAVALGVLAPVAAALIPLINVGPGENSDCAALLAQVRKKPQASRPPRTAANKGTDIPSSTSGK